MEGAAEGETDDATTGAGDDPSGDASPSSSAGPGESGDPTGDPSGDPSGDPTGDPSGDPTGDDPSTTGDDDSGSSDDGGPEPCANGEGICLAPPLGWSGPGAPDDHGVGVPADCGDAEVLISANGSFAAPAATCGCVCGNSVGASCPDARLIAWGDDNTCGGAEQFSQVIQELPHPLDECNFIDTSAPLSAAGYWTIETISEGGGCTPNATIDIPSAAFGDAVSLCDMEPLTMACDGDAECFADPAVPACVWRQGEHACPAGEFSERTVYYTGGITDTRSCTQCECGDPEGSCPSSVADVYNGHYCNGPPSMSRIRAIRSASAKTARRTASALNCTSVPPPPSVPPRAATSSARPKRKTPSRSAARASAAIRPRPRRGGRGLAF